MHTIVCKSCRWIKITNNQCIYFVDWHLVLFPEVSLCSIKSVSMIRHVVQFCILCHDCNLFMVNLQFDDPGSLLSQLSGNSVQNNLLSLLIDQSMTICGYCPAEQLLQRLLSFTVSFFEYHSPDLFSSLKTKSKAFSQCLIVIIYNECLI